MVYCILFNVLWFPTELFHKLFQNYSSNNLLFGSDGVYFTW